MKYFILEKETKRELIAFIENYLVGGWELQGGVSVSQAWYKGVQYCLYAQALVLKEYLD